MDWSSDNIRRTFNQIIIDSKRLSKEEIENKHKNFRESFEKLYNIAIESVVNKTVQSSLNKLDMMLKTRDNMNSGKMEKLTADMVVGNRLGDEFIYQKVHKPTKEDYKRAVDKLKSGGTAEDIIM